MKKNVIFIFFFLFVFALTSLFGQDRNANVITSDIDNFWLAYDKITTTKDSTTQYNYLNTLFLEKGTPGLKAIMQVRRYTPKSYLDAINTHPLFWTSIRANTNKAKTIGKEIARGVQQLKTLYPPLKPSNIYFTMGAFRTGGTALDSLVLIGSELAMADSTTVSSEFEPNMAHLRTYFASNPIKSIVFTNVHEYVHTQQNAPWGYDLLSQCVLEGVAEFVAVKATGQPSSTPAIAYGKAHDKQIQAKFVPEMFSPFTIENWVWNNTDNEFKTRDLGYYVGYAICEKYYNRARNKQQAIKEMIELNYEKSDDIENFAKKAGYFSINIKKNKRAYEKSRPVITKILPFENGNQAVNPSLTTLTFVFSEKMDKEYRSFEMPPLGEKNLLRAKKFLRFSEDGTAATFEIELKPNQHYQILPSEGFRTEKGIPLKPYLIDFKTGN
ncbi:MAG: hypothetical protein RLZZ292_3593 [Bacteroidota bacterium]|jgi:hypothetical protein